MGKEVIAGDTTYRIRATCPDGHIRDNFVSAKSWLLVAQCMAAPIHAFGPPVRTETRISGYRNVNGALFPTKYDEYDITSGNPLDGGPGWVELVPNVPLSADFFSPPPEPNEPLPRMLNALYRARAFPGDALGWYTDFRRNSSTAGINTEAGVEAVGYQCLKNGAMETGVLLLEANVRDYPNSAAAYFGLGRAYRTAGREDEAIQQFRKALQLDPNCKRAADALAEPVKKE